MTKNEYFEELKKIKEEYNRKRQELAKDFVASNLQAQKGDIIGDGHIYIRLESIEIRFSDMPFPLYKGEKVKKNGEPLKRGGGFGCITRIKTKNGTKTE